MGELPRCARIRVTTHRLRTAQGVSVCAALVRSSDSIGRAAILTFVKPRDRPRRYAARIASRRARCAAAPRRRAQISDQGDGHANGRLAQGGSIRRTACHGGIRLHRAGDAAAAAAPHRHAAGAGARRRARRRDSPDLAREPGCAFPAAAGRRRQLSPAPRAAARRGRFPAQPGGRRQQRRADRVLPGSRRALPRHLHRAVARRLLRRVARACAAHQLRPARSRARAAAPGARWPDGGREPRREPGPGVAPAQAGAARSRARHGRRDRGSRAAAPTGPGWRSAWRCA